VPRERIEDEEAMFRRGQMAPMWLKTIRSKIESRAHVESPNKIDEGLPEGRREKEKVSDTCNQ
jgi:hypothetical protein